MVASYLDQLGARLGPRYAAGTRRRYLSAAADFLAHCGERPVYSRAEMAAYLDHLILAGFRSSTIHTTMAGVRALLDANGLAWPLRPQDMHLGLPEVDPQAPALSPEEVCLLIRGVRRLSGLPRVTTALASVYGLRGDEIARALAEGCDGRTLVVQTAKGGRRREHAIPSRLAFAVTVRPTVVSTRYLHEVFEMVLRRHVREQRPREGWHSLRRALVTGLYATTLPERDIHRWMGWRTMGREIALRYYQPDPRELDARVYAVHPFLASWGTA